MAYTITQIWLADDLHPGSDLDGNAIRQYANVLAPFLANEVR